MANTTDTRAGVSEGISVAATGAKSSVNTGYQVTSKGPVTINSTSGMGADMLAGLVGDLTKASGSQIAAITGANKDQLAALSEASNSQLDKLTQLLTQKTDTQAGNPKTLAWVAAAGLGALVLFAYFVFSKD